MIADLKKHTVRDRRLSVRLTDREYKVLSEIARGNKKTLSKFVREILLPTDVKEIRELLED